MLVSSFATDLLVLLVVTASTVNSVLSLVRDVSGNVSDTDSEDEMQEPQQPSYGEAMRLTEEVRREVQEGLRELQEGMVQLKNELRSKAAVANNVQNPPPLYLPPHHYYHYYHHHRRPALYDPDDTGAAEELTALRELLQATEIRLQATENRLRTTESRLQTMEDKYQSEAGEPQATQSRSRSCEDKLLATQERLQSAERKLALVSGSISNTQALRISFSNQSSTFVRWGRTRCPNYTELVYAGVAGGAWHGHQGAASNRLCLTLEPEFDDTVPSANLNYIYGIEYQEIPGHHDHDVPCSVCQAPQSATIMVPATLTCPPGWFTQYSGHLVAGFYNHAAAGEFLCLDGQPENLLSGNENQDGALFYYTVTQCGSLPCPPYVNTKVVTCVVCSK